jgi:hypothetical protein
MIMLIFFSIRWYIYWNSSTVFPGYYREMREPSQLHAESHDSVIVLLVLLNI